MFSDFKQEQPDISEIQLLYIENHENGFILPILLCSESIILAVVFCVIQ